MVDPKPREPVGDFATDFDHFDPDFVADPYPVFADLQERCPIAHTDRYGGVNILTTFEDVNAASHDPHTYSSRRIMISEVPTERRGEILPPINLDPPEQVAPRRAMLPFFNPTNTQRWESTIREICKRLIDDVIDGEGCDLAGDYGKHIPGDLTAAMFGLPNSAAEQFREWVHLLLEVGPTEPDLARSTTAEIFAFMMEQIEDRKANGGDDVVTYMLGQRIDDEPMDDPTMARMLVLLMLAGIDTTWSAIGSSFLHLATHPEDRRRLAEDPSLIPGATEEFLRAYSPVAVARIATEDSEIGGCPISEGEWVMLAFPAANRDPEVFPDPHHVDIMREKNRHAAFGLGVHRCLGSNLARLEMNIAVEMWLERIPEFNLVEGTDVKFAPGTVRGPRNIPVTFG